MSRSALYTTADLMRWTGLTRQAVTKAGRAGGLKAAKVGKGRELRWNVGHPAAREWLESHGVDVDAIAPGVVTSRPAQAVERELGTRAGDDLDAIGHLSFREVLDRYGTGPEFLHFTRSRKELAAARRQEKLLAELDGKLITRELVHQGVTMAIDATFRRLLRDTPPTLARKVGAAAKAGEEPEAIEALIRDVISSQLEMMVAEVERAIRGETE